MILKIENKRNHKTFSLENLKNRVLELENEN